MLYARIIKFMADLISELEKGIVKYTYFRVRWNSAELEHQSVAFCFPFFSKIFNFRGIRRVGTPVSCQN